MTETNETRKPVAMCQTGAAGSVVVVCNDGSAFVMLASTAASLYGRTPGIWHPLEPIPGTHAALAAAVEETDTGNDYED